MISTVHRTQFIACGSATLTVDSSYQFISYLAKALIQPETCNRHQDIASGVSQPLSFRFPTCTIDTGERIVQALGTML